MIRYLESTSFLFFFRDHLRSTLGITCGRGSFAVHFGDHLRSQDHLRLGIICGTVQLYRPPAQLRWPNIVFSARSKGFADARQRAHKDYKITNMAPIKRGLFVLCL